MHTSIQVVRSLKTPFKLNKKTAREFVFDVESAELGDTAGPTTISFFYPTHVWASTWDESREEWRDVLDYSVPEHGEINEAFVKPVGHFLKFSFSDLSKPLVRWGFTAAKVEVRSKLA